MSDFVFYPVTGDGESAATAYTWNTGTIAFNTPSSWAAVSSFETLNIGTTVTTGTVPGGGANIGLIAGAIDPNAFALYTPDPAEGDPYIASSSYPVDVLLNSGSVEVGSMVLAGFNEFADILGGDATPQFPTLDVEGATLAVTGNILDTGTVTFPPINLGFFGTISSATASGGGTIDLGNHASVDVAGTVASTIQFNFNDADGNVLEFDGVSKADPTGFLGSVTGFAAGDTILLPSVPASVDGIPTTGSYDVASGVLTISVGEPVLISLDIPGLSDSSSVSLAPSGTGIELVTCFAAGTMIRTVTGETLVERLRVGDLLPVVATGAPRPIRWIGRRKIDCRRHPQPKLVWPVRVAAGAFANDVPARDLLLSPDHSVFVDGVLIPIKYLINETTIAQLPCERVTYYHVELDRHDVILAEGMAVESYLDTGDRARFDNGGGVVRLHPDFCALTWDARGCAPLVVTGPAFDRAMRTVAARAQDAEGRKTGILAAERVERIGLPMRPAIILGNTLIESRGRIK